MAERNKRVILILLSSLLFLLTIAISLFLLFYRVPKIDSIQYYLTQCDEEISGNQLKLAEGSLLKATSFTQNRLDWLSIVKRSYLISQKQDDWKLYNNYAERAVKLYQGNDEFWAFYLSSLMWTGQYNELEKYESRLKGESFPTLQAEIRLIKESLLIDKSLPPYRGVLHRLEKERDAEFYELIGNITQIDGLKIDAAMLWMGLEEKDRAIQVLNKLMNPEDYAQIVGNIYWDNREYEKALIYLDVQNSLDKKNHTERWTLNNMLGDGYFFSGDWEKADYYYLKSLEIKSEDNWKPLVNRSLLNEQAGIYKTASEIIFQAIEKYGNRREVVLYFLDNWYSTYPVRAERVISHYLMNNPKDVDVLLQNFITFPEEIPPEKYHAFLWKLFNENTTSETITRYLLWYMLGLGDFESVGIVMERHARVVGYEPQWFSLFKGVALALNKPPRLVEAEQELEKYYLAYKDSFGQYNLSVIQEKLGNTKKIEALND